MDKKESKNHVFVAPWPVSEGIRTWCGYAADDPRMEGENIALMPETVTCDDCIWAMRRALGSLSEWCPRMSSSKDRALQERLAKQEEEKWISTK